MTEAVVGFARYLAVVLGRVVFTALFAGVALARAEEEGIPVARNFGTARVFNFPIEVALEAGGLLIGEAGCVARSFSCCKVMLHSRLGILLILFSTLDRNAVAASWYCPRNRLIRVLTITC